MPYSPHRSRSACLKIRFLGTFVRFCCLPAGKRRVKALDLIAKFPLSSKQQEVQCLGDTQSPKAHLVLKARFTEILDQLVDEKPVYADLLRGRFWEGQQIEEMLTAERPLAMSRRSFSNYHNRLHCLPTKLG